MMLAKHIYAFAFALTCCSLTTPCNGRIASPVMTRVTPPTPSLPEVAGDEVKS